MLNGEFLKALSELCNRHILSTGRVAKAFHVSRQTIWHWRRDLRVVSNMQLYNADRIFPELYAEEAVIRNICKAIGLLNSVQADALSIDWNTVRKAKGGKIVQLRANTLKRFMKGN